MTCHGGEGKLAGAEHGHGGQRGLIIRIGAEQRLCGVRLAVTISINRRIGLACSKPGSSA